MNHHPIQSNVWSPFLSCYQKFSIPDQITELCDEFADLRVYNTPVYQRGGTPPSAYLCHLCFTKGHFIRNCPQVSENSFT